MSMIHRDLYALPDDFPVMELVTAAHLGEPSFVGPRPMQYLISQLAGLTSAER